MRVYPLGSPHIDKKVLDFNFILISLLYLTALSLASHFLRQDVLAFGLLPFLFILLPVRMDAHNILLAYFACTLVFFEAGKTGSFVSFFYAHDSLLIVFLVLFFLKRKELSRFTVPVNANLLMLYLFLGYALVMSFVSLPALGMDFYLLLDTKTLVTLAFLPVFFTANLYAPRRIFNFFILLLSLISIHGLVCIVRYLTTFERVMTWNEIYLSDGFIISLILFRISKSAKLKLFLFASSFISLVGIVISQTRGIWLSTILSVCLYLFFIRKEISLKALKMAFSLILFSFILFSLVNNNFNLSNVISSRMVAYDKNELSKSNTSLGYRIYESYQVWKEKSFFGHGSGARIYLYNPFINPDKFISWWSIHSEYFELLHKYGFLGLTLFSLFLFLLIRSALRISRRRNKVVSAFGFVVFIILVNHSMVSITSGYFIREHIVVLLLLLTGLTHYYAKPPAYE
ncbi:O-antigen ligase family protein [Fibrobacterota bacterium]